MIREVIGWALVFGVIELALWLLWEGWKTLIGVEYEEDEED